MYAVLLFLQHSIIICSDAKINSSVWVISKVLSHIHKGSFCLFLDNTEGTGKVNFVVVHIKFVLNIHIDLADFVT